MVEAVNDEGGVIGVEGDTGGTVELAVARPELAPAVDFVALAVVADHEVLVGVGAPDVAVLAEREALGPDQVATTHLGEELILDAQPAEHAAAERPTAVLGEAGVGDVEDAVGCARHGCGVGEALGTDKVPDRVTELPGTPGDRFRQHG